MLTNVGIPVNMSLSTIPPLNDVEVDERMHHFKQLLYDLEWKKIKDVATSMEAEFNKIKLETKQEMARIGSKYSKLEAETRKETKLDNTRLQSLGRLKVLEEMDKNVTDVILAVHHRLGRVDHYAHQKAYRRILYALIVQAVCRLLEPEAIVVFRVNDVALGKTVFEQAQAKYKEITGLSVELRADSKHFLSLESCGGVNVRSLKGSRTVTNTLAIRLDNVLYKANPMIRIALYGRNPNRLFFDLSEMSGSPTLFGWANMLKRDKEGDNNEADKIHVVHEEKMVWTGSVHTYGYWGREKRSSDIKSV